MWPRPAGLLATPGGPDDGFSHVATPDGCVEIIRRLRGRSIWREEQPPCFVAGLSTRPAELRLGGGSAFVALRVWPWAWSAIALPASRIIVDDWRDLATAAPGFAVPDDPAAVFDALCPGLIEADQRPLVEAILASRSVAELVGRSGLPHRWLQRWFEQQRRRPAPHLPAPVALQPDLRRALPGPAERSPTMPPSTALPTRPTWRGNFARCPDRGRQLRETRRAVRFSINSADTGG